MVIYMSNDKGRYRREPADIISRVTDLEVRISRMERTPSIGDTSIDSGTLRVKDAAGIVRVELGLLSDGSYGLNVKENASEIGFHQVPFIYTATAPAVVGTGETCSSTTYADLATPGPFVVVPIRSTGRILVIATAQIQWTTPFAGSTANDGRFDVEFSGANTRSPNEAIDPLVGVTKEQIITTAGATNAQAHIATITAQAEFSGLTPGNTTITMKYRNPQAATNTSDFFRRVLTVINI